MAEKEEEENNQEFMLKPSHLTSSESNSMVSATLGRVMHTLLSARSKKLQGTICRLHSPPKIAPLSVSLEQSLWFLRKYVGEAVEKEETLDEILVPMIEHSLKFGESKHSSQPMILLNLLFQDEILFQALATNLADVIVRKEDRFIALGWCTLARDLVEYESCMKNFMTNGIQQRYPALLKIFGSCITHLLALLCNGSTLQGGFELPTRLAVAAADFVLSLTVALTQKDLVCDDSVNKEKSFSSDIQKRPISLLAAATSDKKVNSPSKGSEFSGDMGIKLLLWDHIDDLIILVERLRAWSRKSRLLHSKGLERVFNWLQATKKRYAHIQNGADVQMQKTGTALLSSCWRHYGMLLHLEDQTIFLKYSELLGQYLSGIQFYADNTDKPTVEKDGGIETMKFFLNCLSLLLGRLDCKQFDTAIAEYGPQLSNVLISQLHCADEEVINGAVCILKAAIFRPSPRSSKDCSADTKEINAALPLLLHLLDERDGAAKAVVNLVAEYCSLCPDDQCLKEVLKGLMSENVSRRMNSVDIMSSIIHMSSESGSSLSHHTWQDLSEKLLDCLEDEVVVIQTVASKLIPIIDPSLVLPALVRLVYSPHERVWSLSRDTLLGVLKNHKDETKVLCLLLDCLSNLCHSPDLAGVAAAGNGSKLDTDRVLNLIPEWSKIVEEWNLMINALLDKLFAEPSNAVIVRFLSYISDHLADSADLVFHRLLLYAAGRKDSTEEESFLEWKHSSCQNVDALEQPHNLFNRLCPLLVIRLLPLRVFDDLGSAIIYGQHRMKYAVHDAGPLTIDTECITALLIDRALDKYESEDVRKLAAELCGRIHPHVLIPTISSQLECAAKAKDTMKVKVCLFSICTSLMIRGKDSYQHTGMIAIRNTIEAIFSWPLTDGDDVLKAQHGCIDCLAWMMCSELEGPKAIEGSTSNEAFIVQEKHHHENVDSVFSVWTYVTCQLIHDEYLLNSSRRGRSSTVSEAKPHLSFRLCMANVLISACQKISDTGKKPLAHKILPPIIRSSRVTVEPDIRAAYNQVLFSVVYHLKSAVLPYSSDILKVALQSLRDGSEKERMTGAKVLASLMASEEPVVNSISGALLEVRALLQSVSTSDPSVDVRQTCQKLLLCVTF